MHITSEENGEECSDLGYNLSLSFGYMWKQRNI